MTVTRTLSLALCALALGATGCRTRDGGQNVATDELRAETIRLSTEIENQQQEIARLKSQRDQAVEELNRSREQGGSVGKQLDDLLKGGDIPGTYRTERGGIALDENFAFDKGSAELNEAGSKTIKLLADKLNSGDHAKAKIIVEGHTDTTPVKRASTVEKYRDNWGLSAARAAEVVRALQGAGVATDRLFGAFRGEHDPRDPADKAKNRRVELYLK